MLNDPKTELKVKQKVSIQDLPATTRVSAPNFNLSPTVARMETSATLSTNIFVKHQRKIGADLTNFGLGESPFGAPNILVKALGENAHHASYLPTEGILELRENISKFYDYYFNYKVEPGRIVVGPGSKELIFLTMAALDSPWLLDSPSWVSYESQARILGRKTWRAYTSYKNEYRITEKDLRKKFMIIDDGLDGKTLAILLNYPNNPTGLTLKKSEVQKIAKFARNNEIIILSDEIYANVTHNSFGYKHHSMGLEYPEGTIVTGGISKDRSLGGWRLGVAIMPEDQPLLLKSFKSIGSETYSSVAAPLQHAAITAYNCNPEVNQHIVDSTMVHDIVGQFVHLGLMDAGFSTPRPEGAFYLMPSLNHYSEELKENGIHNSRVLAKKLIIDYNVVVIPGVSFGLRLEDLAFRMAYIDYDGPQVLATYQANPEKALEDPPKFVQENCPSVYLGIKRLKNFTDDLLHK